MRLVNLDTAPADHGFNEPRSKRPFIAPGETGEFNENNKSIQKRMALRKLVSEGEALASRASSLMNAPSVGEMLQLKAELVKREVVIEDLRSRDSARAADVKRMEEGFSDLTAKNLELAAKAGDAEMLRARVAELETLLSAATEPPAEPPTETETRGRSRRNG